MALTVIQRPEEDLYVEENPTVYDVPYFTSRWNTANLPLTYKITNTRFPINTEDIIEDILTISNNAGFAELGLDSATYTFFEKGSIKITNTTNYNGVWKIKQVIDPDTIVINAPFVADETGNVQNYYDNYNVLVKVYAGLPEYHPSNPSKPMELITDNPITITPQLNNEAVIDVAALVKSKLSLTNDYDVNDLNQFTALFISYAEQYGVSNGITVDVFTSTFEFDAYEGCDSGAENFVQNGTFDTVLSPWSNLDIGESWVQDTGTALVLLTRSLPNSRLLIQGGINVTDGTEYNLLFDYDIEIGFEVTIRAVLGFVIVYQNTLSGSGTIDVNVISNGTGTIYFDATLVTSNTDDQCSVRLDNVILQNVLGIENPCLAYIFATHSALQPQSKYGANLGEYVQNFNGGVFENKWLTLMQQPVLFKGNYFDLSTLIPQSVIQSAIQSGGYFLEVVEFNVNNEVIAENQYPITENLGDGIYRFRLDDKTFQDSTKQFTVQILRIPVNLFVDGNQGTFDVTADPTGNPPGDWNLEKDARAIINFEDTDVYEGTGALSFESRSIFNDNYGLAFTSTGQTANFAQQIKIENINNLNFSEDFTIECRHKLTAFQGTFPYIFSIIFSDNSYIAVRYHSLTDIRLFWLFNFPNVGGNIRVVQQTISSQFNHFVISFQYGVGVRFYLNGVKNELLTDANIAGDKEILNLKLFGGLDNNVYNSTGFSKGCRIYTGRAANDSEALSLYNSNTKDMQPIPVSMQSFLKREFLFNQEQGRTAFEKNNFNEQLSNVDGWRDSNVSFNGGAWVDVSAIN